MAEPHRRAALSLILAAVIFSTGGAAIKAAAFTGWQLVSLRSLIAGLTLLCCVPAARRGWGWRPFLVGGAYAATCFGFVLATRLTTSANAIFLQFASPLYVLLLGPLLLREPISRRDLLCMLPIGLGLPLLLLGGQRAGATAPDPALGNLLALLSGISFAFLVIGLRWLERRDAGGASALTAATLGNFTAFLVALPLALPLGRYPAADWALLGYLGVVQIGLAYVLVAYGVARLSAFEVSVLLLIEPVLNPLWSWLLHREIPAATSLLGGGLVLGAVLLRAWWSRDRAARENPSLRGENGVPGDLTETLSPN